MSGSHPQVMEIAEGGGLPGGIVLLVMVFAISGLPVLTGARRLPLGGPGISCRGLGQCRYGASCSSAAR